MKQVLFFGILLSVLILTGCTTNIYTNSTNNTVKNNTTSTTNVKQDISISGNAYNPPNVTVLAGTTVVWTNNDNVQHTVVSESGSYLNSGAIAPGQQYSYTFNARGVYAYYCTIHPTMRGVIVVQ